MTTVTLGDLESALETLTGRLRVNPPSKHSDHLTEALELLKSTIIPRIHVHYRDAAFIQHAGGADTFVVALLLQTLSGFMNWPEEYLVLANHVALIYPVPDHTIAYHLRTLQRRVGRMYTP